MLEILTKGGILTKACHRHVPKTHRAVLNCAKFHHISPLNAVLAGRCKIPFAWTSPGWSNFVQGGETENHYVT